ncbi:HeH/LEM domain-containing protein [Pseudomonas viridiflava]|uniref:HeH/LEM domain-containing protein n=1 Tax=Pseudomonas viridiflava TaxID=33069 RepID=UPI000F039D0F|nr:HeH/LEM domain-containing protein [Pseudomonas viridiflava]
MKVIYTDKPGSESGTCYRLLSEFFGVISSATDVVVQGDNPSIIEAYKRAGIKVSAAGDDGLRLDGPTISEYVSAGYKASSYPPQGYASRSTDEEVSEALKLEQEAPETDPLKMKVPELKDWLTGKGIEFDATAKKEDLQALVPKE